MNRTSRSTMITINKQTIIENVNDYELMQNVEKKITNAKLDNVDFTDFALCLIAHAKEYHPTINKFIIDDVYIDHEFEPEYFNDFFVFNNSFVKNNVSGKYDKINL